jgi:hypothetical protein
LKAATASSRVCTAELRENFNRNIAMMHHVGRTFSRRRAAAGADPQAPEGRQVGAREVGGLTVGVEVAQPDPEPAALTMLRG